MKLELKENQSALVIEHDEQGMVSVEVFSGGTMDDIHSQLCEAISEKWEGKEYWNELMEIVKTKKQCSLSKQITHGGIYSLSRKRESKVASLVVEDLDDGRTAVYVGTEENDSFAYELCKTLQAKIVEDKVFRDQISSYMESDDEIGEIQEKIYRVREFPIFHRFLVTLFRREQLTIRLKYKEVFRRIGEWEVVRLCSCDDPTCATVIMKRDETLGVKLKEDVVIHIDCSTFIFGTDGTIDMENLGNFPYQSPFRQELRDIMSGKKLGWWYGDNNNSAQMAVDCYFKNKASSYQSGWSVSENLGYKVVGCGDENIVVWDDII